MTNGMEIVEAGTFNRPQTTENIIFMEKPGGWAFETSFPADPA
jgi:hypothetical protein